MKVGKKIKQLKKEHNITRKQISDSTKIDVLTIKSIEESGNGNFARIKKIFLFFGYDAEIVLKKK
jgi:transcriptional regulator with XRE-family HTH domain